MRSVFNIKAHGCGDTCLDVDPRACQGCSYVPGDVRNLPFENKQFGVAYNSHVLEHMATLEDCTAAWSELHRVAEVVLTCVPSKSSIMAWLAPEHHLWVREVALDQIEVTERQTGRVATLDALPI